MRLFSDSMRALASLGRAARTSGQYKCNDQNMANDGELNLIAERSFTRHDRRENARKCLARSLVETS